MKVFSKETRERMSESAKKRCNEEWLKKQRARATNLDPVLVKEMYESGMTQKEIAGFFNVLQKTICRHMKNNGIKSRSTAKRNQRRERNDYWKGGKTISDSGYVLIKVEGHPRASIAGDYVEEHILVMEKHIGRYLRWFGAGHPESEVIHHKNGIKNDNRIENLLLTNFVEHMEIHKKERDALCQSQLN